MTVSGLRAALAADPTLGAGNVLLKLIEHGAPLDGPDGEGCNWSLTLVLDRADVAAEVYGLAYAQVIATARASWNLL